MKEPTGQIDKLRKNSLSSSKIEKNNFFDIVFVDLPSVGDKVTAKEPIATIESVKAVSEIYAPISGEVMEINDSLEHSPEFVNQDPYGKGWIFIIEPVDPKETNNLLAPAAYTSFINGKG